MHYRVNPLAEEDARVVEIGAGTLNHLRFHKSYRAYDAVEPFADLYRGTELRSQVSSLWADVNEIAHDEYDYVIAIATLEHLANYPPTFRSRHRCLNQVEDASRPFLRKAVFFGVCAGNSSMRREELEVVAQRPIARADADVCPRIRAGGH